MSRMRPTKFAHVVYRTRRFEQMLSWHETVFDAKVQYQNPALAFLTYDDEHHRFAFANMSLFQVDGSETDRHDLIGVDHVAYTSWERGQTFISRLSCQIVMTLTRDAFRRDPGSDITMTKIFRFPFFSRAFYILDFTRSGRPETAVKSLPMS